MSQPDLGRGPILIAVALLTAMVVLVFFPVVGFEFVNFDVFNQVIDNPHIQGLTIENVKHILTSRCITSYYPVRTLTFALDYQIWGMDPGGFKLTNVAIHLVNSLLIFWLILRLFQRPPSGETARCGWPEVVLGLFSAGVFAVHPVVVESVAWVAGREELLMTLGALGCLHFHLAARHLSAKPGKTGWMLACYAGAVISCAVACLSNAVGAVVPALVTALDAVTLTRPTLWGILRRTAVLWIIGITTFAVKSIGEFNDPVGEAASISWDRLALVLEVYWLNLKTLVWPTELAVVRAALLPKSFHDPTVILGAVAVGATCAALWTFRRRRLMLVGLVWFLLALAPYSQVMSHHLHRADRFLYLPLAGLVVAIAAGARPWTEVLRRRLKVSVMIAGTSVLVVAVAASTVQLRTWSNMATMWENCLRVDPNNGLAHCMLADSLIVRHEYHRAISHYEAAIRLPPSNSMARSQLALFLATCEEEHLRDFERAIDLATLAWLETPKYLRTITGVYGLYARDLARRGEFAGAIDNYRKAVEIHGRNRPALLDLAHLLTTCEIEELRNAEEAVRLATRACELPVEPTAGDLRILAAAQAGVDQLDMAVATVQKALTLAEETGDDKLADQLRRQLELYRKGAEK